MMLRLTVTRVAAIAGMLAVIGYVVWLGME